eukprot:SAG31_NODE_10425_length_1140_cov_0.856868_1_plen_141_part_00
MEVVDELILMDYTATCHRPGSGGADSPCEPHEFLQQAYPFFAHSRLLKSRSANRSHEVLVSLALEVFGDPKPDPSRTRGKDCYFLYLYGTFSAESPMCAPRIPGLIKKVSPCRWLARPPSPDYFRAGELPEQICFVAWAT